MKVNRGSPALHTIRRILHVKLLCINKMASEKIALIGSGNWGSAVATIIGQNVYRFDKVQQSNLIYLPSWCVNEVRRCSPSQFDKEVRMWVFEEVFQGRKLTETINSTHENVSWFSSCRGPPVSLMMALSSH